MKTLTTFFCLVSDFQASAVPNLTQVTVIFQMAPEVAPTSGILHVATEDSAQQQTLDCFLDLASFMIHDEDNFFG